MSDVYTAALAAHDAGLCVLPPKEDGTKAPDTPSWKARQTIPTTRQEIDAWYAAGRRSGIGYVTGAVSGNLELLDFDDLDTYKAFRALAEAAGLAPILDRVREGYLETSPGGVHLLYRCETIAGNTKLARRVDNAGEIAVLIETRGEGGYVVAAPSNGRVHPAGGAYRVLRGGVATIATITPDERAELHALARSLDQMPKDKAPGAADRDSGLPGDDYNQRGDVLALLKEHGWAVVFERDGVLHLRRPGKDRGTSATFGIGGTRYFYPFTSSTIFEPGRAYSPFAVYAILEHAGDFIAAAHALAEGGYGEPAARIVRGSPGVSGQGLEDLPAPVFPVDVLPPVVRTYVNAAGESLSVPPEMVAVPLLGLAGALIGNRLHVALKASWREYPSLYIAIVARPGAAKTPALNLAKWPLDAMQGEALDAYRLRLAAFDDEMDAWKNEGQKRGEPKPEKPKLRHYFSTEPTIEALAAILEPSPGVAVVRDEISGWVGSLDQYRGGKGSDRQQFLSLWSGGVIKADRKGGATIYVEHPVACVVGGIQPDLAGVLHDEAQRRDGFVERILPVVPEVGVARWTEAAPTTDQYRDVLDAFRTLDRLPYADRTGDGLPTGSVNLSAGAKTAFVQWFDENAALIANTDGLAAGFCSKLPAHVARLALILHALWHPDDPRVMIEAARMADAIELGEFFRAHIGRFLALLKAAAPSGSAGLDARIVRRLGKASESAGWTDRTDLYRGLGNVPADALTAALERLEEAGVIERRIVRGATKNTTQYRISSFHYSHYSSAASDGRGASPSEGAETANSTNYKRGNSDDWADGEEGIL